MNLALVTTLSSLSGSFTSDWLWKDFVGWITLPPIMPIPQNNPLNTLKINILRIDFLLKEPRTSSVYVLKSLGQGSTLKMSTRDRHQIRVLDAISHLQNQHELSTSMNTTSYLPSESATNTLIRNYHIYRYNANPTPTDQRPPSLVQTQRRQFPRYSSRRSRLLERVRARDFAGFELERCV